MENWRIYEQYFLLQYLRDALKSATSVSSFDCSDHNKSYFKLMHYLISSDVTKRVAKKNGVGISGTLIPSTEYFAE